MQTFEDILQALLSEMESNPGAEVETILPKLVAKFELSAEEVAEMKESFMVLDEINAKALDLENARANGQTRDGWVRDQLSDIADKCGDQDSRMMEEIEKGVQTSLDEIVIEEE